MNSNQRRLKLLVAEDAELLREVLCAQLRRLGHEAIAAENGEQAVTRYIETSPDVVLMDWVMPIMDGIAATRAIRALPGARWTPIIMLSAHGEEKEFVNALMNGCDDYLIKPIKLPMLEAKIHALQRIAEMHNEIERSQRELQHFYAKAEEELALARHIMGQLVQRKDESEASSNVPDTRWSQAASSVSGDITLTSTAENGVTYTMLADATGHGLAAAITLIPVVDVFYAMTTKGFSVASIVEEMNRQVRTYCPIERFVALTLVGVNVHESIIEVWNGGIPPLLLLDSQGKLLRRFQSRYPPLGVLKDTVFRSASEFFHYDAPLQLIAFSDGLPEAGDGEHFGYERILAALSAAPPAQRLHAVQQALRDFLGDAKHHDDISLVLIECLLPSMMRDRSNPVVGHSAPLVQSDWSLQTTLSAQQIKTIDLVPMMVNWAQAMGLAREHSSTFFLVVTELFTNAVEHGLLELSSEIKLETNGFERFIELRQQRLQALSEGQIHISLLSRDTAEGTVVSIHIHDSGKGFAAPPNDATDLSNNNTPSGRGIALVRQFCRTLEYRGCGNEVYAELVC
jgi:two-component system, HptB-dependent secretion and biofilm response regulator